ncbi:MAG: STAS domain-containing protein [Mycobacterium sp.]
MTVIDNVLEQLDFGERFNGHAVSISAHPIGATTVITVNGEIDASNADFTASVLHGFATLNGKVAVDLSNVDFIGTQGLRLLIEFHDTCRHRNTAAAIVPCQMLRRLMNVIEIGSHLPVAESVSDAVQSVEGHLPTTDRPAFTRVDPEKLRC